MKKISLITIISLILILAACSQKSALEKKVSQLRFDILFSGDEYYDVYAFKEICENPQKDDGEIGERKNVLTFKIVFKNDIPLKSSPVIQFSLDGITYRKEFEYKPLSNFVCCSLFLPALPGNKLDVSLEFDKKAVNHTLLTVLNKKTLNYTEVLGIIDKSDDEDVQRFLNGEKPYEVKLRLISSDGYNYYFIGFYNEDEFVGFLIDGTTGEIIAKKK